MQIKLEIDKFKLEADYPPGTEQTGLEMLAAIAGIFVRDGLDEGGNRLAELLKREYEGQPGWKFTEG